MSAQDQQERGVAKKCRSDPGGSLGLNLVEIDLFQVL